MKTITLICSLCLLLTTQIRAQDRPSKPVDNINPANAGRVCFRGNIASQVVSFVSDAENKCWFWKCERQRRRVGLVPMRCALGTFVSSFYITGDFNPCSEAYNVDDDKFDCTRKEINRAATPPCFAQFQLAGTCKNNGIIASEGNRCWCQCPSGFGGHDCSMVVGAAGSGRPVVPPTSSADDPCPGGIPRGGRSFCREAAERMGQRNPCQNGGQCIDQCVNYVCQCVPPFTSGRNCEAFECTSGVECLNGGTCRRGARGNAEVATCTCAPGFTGVMCEISV